MAQILIFVFGFVSTFVLSGAQRNRKLARAHSAHIKYVGWFCFGCSAALSVLLFGLAGYDWIAG